MVRAKKVKRQPPTTQDIIDHINIICNVYESSCDKIEKIVLYLNDCEKLIHETKAEVNNG